MPFITVVGGTNIDIQGFSHNALRHGDSNPGRITMSAGGVGRNIAENLARLGEQVHLLTAFGTDDFGQEIATELDDIGVDISKALRAKGERTSVYLCVLDGVGGLYVAVSDMDVIDRLDTGWIDERADLIDRSDLCVVDTNLQKSTIDHLVQNHSGVPFLLDTVSAVKTVRAKDCFGVFTAVKPNREEAEILTEVKIVSDVDLLRAAAVFHDRGTRSVFISLGKRGVFFSTRGGERGIAAQPDTKVVNVSGAGDALTAAIAYGMVHGYSAEQTARFGAAAAALTAQSERTVSRSIDAASVAACSERIRIERSWDSI